jgi:hypothetical protein
MNWRLTVSYAIGRGEVRAVDAKVCESVAPSYLTPAHPSASGAGFGERDLEFDFDSRDEAVRAGTRVLDAMDDVTVTVGSAP